MGNAYIRLQSTCSQREEYETQGVRQRHNVIRLQGRHEKGNTIRSHHRAKALDPLTYKRARPNAFRIIFLPPLISSVPRRSPPIVIVPPILCLLFATVHYRALPLVRRHPLPLACRRPLPLACRRPLPLAVLCFSLVAILNLSSATVLYISSAAALYLSSATILYLSSTTILYLSLTATLCLSPTTLSTSCLPPFSASLLLFSAPCPRPFPLPSVFYSVCPSHLFLHLPCSTYTFVMSCISIITIFHI